MKENIHCRIAASFKGVSLILPKNKRKVFLIMKLVAVILFLINMQVSALTYAQKISINKNSLSIKEAFTELRAQSGYYFIYNEDLIAKLKPVNVQLKNVSIEDALNQILKGQPLSYTIEDKVIIVKEKKALPEKLQTRKITGKVVDADDGAPLVGVSVRIKGLTAGSITNTEGLFSLTVNTDDKILLLTYIGYSSQEIPITSEINYNITLTQESKQLQEVVVAFGTVDKRELTNSVTQITAKDIEQRPITNLNSALAGAVPGIQTTSGSGQPGSGPSVAIRGFGSITGSNDPLYVVDGAPYEGEINAINPDDIESISVLKDASATALYGARAANGIILVTTKKGKKNRNNITLRLTQAVSSRALPDYQKVNAYQYYPLAWESLVNGDAGNPLVATQTVKSRLGWNPFNVADDEIVFPDGTLNPDAKLLYPDDLSFKNAIQRTGLRKDYSLTLSGGSTKTDHYVSLNYLDEKGYVIGSDFKRFSGRVRVNTQPTKWLSTGVNLFGNYSKSDEANENSGINENPFYVDVILAPIYPIFQHNAITGAYLLDNEGYKKYDAGDYRPVMTGRNIIAETLFNLNQKRRNTVIANTNADATFLKNFKFSTKFSATLINNRIHSFDNSEIGDAVGAGRASRTNTMSALLNFNQVLEYNKAFGDHKIKAIAGHENYLNYYDYFSGSKRLMGVDDVKVLDNFTIVTGLGSYDREYKTEGYLSKLDYNYDNRYLFSASARRDASSRFNTNNKWGNFWSLSGAWNIDKEAFFKTKWVNILKLRGSYGQVGNDNVGGYFSNQGLYTLGYNNGTEPGGMLAQIASDDLQWETNANSDVAVEFSLFKNRLNGTIEAFSRQSDNLLFRITTPVTSGVTTQNVNFGSMRNRGLEIELNGDIIKKKKFKWNSALNWSKIDNKILSLPDSYNNRISFNNIYTVSRSLQEFWVRKSAGVNPATGGELFYPTNPDNVSSPVTIGDQVFTSDGSTGSALFYYAGSAIPDFFGSINNTFTYKNFSFQLMLMYQYGGLVYDNDYQSLMNRGTMGRALHIDALKRWQKPGDITDVPRLASNNNTLYNSDRFLTDASYINLRTASLTYTLPKKFLSKYNVQSSKLFLNGENLLITSSRKGLDPTQTYTGDASYTYAPSRIVSFGLTVTF